MNVSDARIAQVLRGWYLIEMLTPQTLDSKWFPRDLGSRTDEASSNSFVQRIRFNDLQHVELFWHNRDPEADSVASQGDSVEPLSFDELETTDDGNEDEEETTPTEDASTATAEAKYIVYLGVARREYFDRAISDALQIAETNDDRRSAPERIAIGALFVTADGKYIEGSLQVSTLPWYLGRIARTGLSDVITKPLSNDFENFLYESRERLPIPGNTPLEMSHLIAAVRFMRTACSIESIPLDYDVLVCRRSLRKEENHDILNSFYQEDIADSINRADAGHLSPLMRNLFAVAGSQVDTAVGKPLFSDLCGPEHIASSAWPKIKNFPATMQHIVCRLVEKEVPNGSLLAVNGPPGTGKTTLIRSVVVDRVTARARALSAFSEPLRSWTSLRKEAGESPGIFKPHPEICGFEIVVSSANNKAIENITKDFPKLASVSGFEDVLREIDYFTGVSDAVANYQRPKRAKRSSAKLSPGRRRDLVKTWGLLCATLGKSANRADFVASAFDGGADDEQAFRTFWSYLVEDDSCPVEWSEAVRDFVAAEDQLKALKAEIAQRAEPIDHANVQIVAPYVDETLYTAQVLVFIQALRLHRAFIIASRDMFRQNLTTWRELLLRPSSVELTEDEARAIWRSAFLVVPVMSTTFASVRRMFSKLGDDAFDLAIIDEAGQAIPQASVGLISRARRALIVGDPLQLEPIVSLPTRVIEQISENYGGESAYYASKDNGFSLQTLADRASRFGTFRDGVGGSSEKWVGVPLVVHRRCIEPMFHVANRFYRGAMIQATEIDEDAISSRHPFGESCWVTGDFLVEAGRSHTAAEEISLAYEIVVRLFWYYEERRRRALEQSDSSAAALWSPGPDVRIITPFRETESLLIDRLSAVSPKVGRYFGERIGTVHKFQGREGELVILVLGLDERHWKAGEFARKRPNFINVAMTRAKHRLYVVGNRARWGSAPFFEDLARAVGEPPGSALSHQAFIERSSGMFTAPLQAIEDALRIRRRVPRRRVS